MSPTYELIDSITLSSAQSSISFNNIPQTYDDLIIIFSSRQSRSEIQSNILIGFNGSTSSFSARYLEGNGASAASSTFARFAGVSPAANATASTFGNTNIHIPNYNSSNYKSYSSTSASENNSTTSYIERISGLWSNSSAVTSIQISSGSSDNFVTNSTFDLYGIKNADDGGRGFFGPAMTGGNEVFTTGDGYKVHVFKTSGTLNVTAPGEVEYLVIAGGGSGGTSTGGAGGGAGGYRSSVSGELSGGGSQKEPPLSLLNGSYSVIVGAGGSGDNNGEGTSGTDSILSNIISIGGGTGGGFGVNGANGGSGGGGVGEFGGGLGGPGGNGTTGQGYSGGNGYYNSNGELRSGGGGGGAGAAASNAGSGTPTAGGAGLYSSITGTSLARGGGGGGSKNTASAAGGVGGGGAGGIVYVNGTSGTPNTGGGGGGQSGGASSGNGGSGIVIIRYKV